MHTLPCLPHLSPVLCFSGAGPDRVAGACGRLCALHGRGAQHLQAREQDPPRRGQHLGLQRRPAVQVPESAAASRVPDPGQGRVVGGRAHGAHAGPPLRRRALEGRVGPPPAQAPEAGQRTVLGAATNTITAPAAAWTVQAHLPH
jgi:hypothetical protein